MTVIPGDPLGYRLSHRVMRAGVRATGEGFRNKIQPPVGEIAGQKSKVDGGLGFLNKSSNGVVSNFLVRLAEVGAVLTCFLCKSPTQGLTFPLKTKGVLQAPITKVFTWDGSPE